MKIIKMPEISAVVNSDWQEIRLHASVKKQTRKLTKELWFVASCLIMPFTACAADWYVDAHATPGGVGTSDRPFQTIQQAVDAASPDDVIKVQPGVYNQGSTNAWAVSHNNISFNQQTRVYVTKRLTIVSVGGKAVTKILGSHGTTSTNGELITYRTDGVQCMVIGADAAGTVVRGFTFENGNAHQSASPNALASGGICSATPSNDNRFLVTDSSFIYCCGRGGGAIHGGTAIRCLFEKCITNYRGSSAYETRLYNCISRDAVYNSVGGSTWDFCDCIAVNCTTFGNFARGGFLRSSSTGFGGSYYNCLCFGNKYVTSTSDDRGFAYNCISDDTNYSAGSSVRSVNAGVITDMTNLCVSAVSGDYRPVSGGYLDGTGNRTYLESADFIPSDELNKDFNGNTIDAESAIAIGVILPAVKVNSGCLKLTSICAVNGRDIAVTPAYVQSESWPMEVRLSQSARAMASGEKPLMGFSGDHHFYLGQHQDAVQMIPPAGGLVSLSAIISAAQFYVGGDNANDLNAGTDVAPFATIQRAVDSTSENVYTIIHVRPGTYGVQNGTYANEPGRMDTDASGTGLKSSICVPTRKSVLVKSTDGSAVTFIEGAPDPQTGGCGANATRCVSVSSSAQAVFSGFTFRNEYAYSNDLVTDEVRSYGGAYSAGASYYQQVYDSVFTANHGRGIARNGWFVRCLFSNNTDIASCVVTYAKLSSCVLKGNGKSNTAYILYNEVDTYNCSMYEDVCGASVLQNINSKVVNCAYDTVNGRMLDFSQSANPIFGTIIKAAVFNTQSLYGATVVNADPYFHAPWSVDLRLQRPSLGVGIGSAADPYGKVSANDICRYMRGDFANNRLVHANGAINAGAYAEDLAEGASDIYVDAVNGNDAYDGSSVSSAKKTLMAAMQTPSPGNARFVALPGHYNEGSAIHSGHSFLSYSRNDKVRQNLTVASRVIVPEGRILVSRDGPDVTFIEGAADPGSTDPLGLGRGPNAIRCVFLERNAMVRGFTIRYGRTDYFERDIDTWDYQDDFYGAGVFGRADSANGEGGLAGTRVENCVITENYADLGGAGGITSFYNCRVTGNWGANYGGFFRHGAAYGCYVANCRGARMCDVMYDCVNCTFDDGNYSVDGKVTPPFDNIKSSARVWNFLLLSSTAKDIKMGGHVKNIVIGNELEPVYSGTPENVCNDIPLASLRQLYSGGKAIANTAPSVDMGCSDAMSLVSDVDAEFQPRVANAAIDIGAFEYDWKPDYGKALGRHVTVTAENGVVETAGVVTLTDGAGFSANWAGQSGRKPTYFIRMTVNGGGVLSVFLNGTLLGELTTSGTLGFSNTLDVNELRFAYAGAGRASIDEMQRVAGVVLNFR